MTAEPVPAAVATGDCELIRTGLLAQPANTLSSLALVAAGLWLMGRAARAADPGRRWVGLVGAATTTAGVGSALLHGSMWSGARLVHDLGLVSVPLAFLAAGLAVLATDRPAAVTGSGLWAGTAGLLALAPTTTDLLLGFAIAGAAGTEAGIWLTGRRRLRAGDRPRYLAAAAAAAGGLGLTVLGRTGGPLCEPASLVQAHAGWHVLISLAVALYASTALTDGSHRGRVAR